MKAQGLPINFIVIAALAILILILAAGFVVAGGSSFSSAVGPETVKSKCQTYCNTLNMYTSNNIESSTSVAMWEQKDYCSKSFSVKGMGTGTCGTLETKLGTSCYVTFEDGTSCRVTCDNSQPICKTTMTWNTGSTGNNTGNNTG